METKVYTDTELLDRIEEEKKKLTPGYLMIAGGAVLALAGFFGFMNGSMLLFVLMILGILLIVFGALRVSQVHKKIKKLLSDHLMPPVLREIFDTADAVRRALRPPCVKGAVTAWR